MADGGIGSLNESSIHSALKKLYAPSKDTEIRVGEYIVDSSRNDLIVEIQTGSFAKIRKKLTSLLAHHPVRLVHPIARDKTIVVYDGEMKEILRTRKSPKRGELLDIVYELVHIPDILGHPRFSLEVLLTREEEIRRADGLGSWRRRGVSIVDRRLVEVLERRGFETIDSYLTLLSPAIGSTFTNRDLAERMGKPVEKVRRLTYCLKRCGAIEVAGTEGKAQHFRMTRDVR
jgi:hypothetical protein